MTVRDVLLEASTQITRRDAETLLAHILQQNRAWLLAHTDDALDPADLAHFRMLVARRSSHEPLQHLTGTQEFFGLCLRVTPDVLIPRPETEHLVEAVLAWAREQPTRTLRFADIGTGSGAIALALAANLPQAQITAIDLSPTALTVARANAERLSLTHRISFLEADLLSRFLEQQVRVPQVSLETRAHAGDPPQSLFDAIVSNPPYVAEADAATLAPEVRDYDPHLALFAGPDGLAVYRRLIPQAFHALRPGGLLALEIGFGQRELVAGLLRGWRDVHFIDDYAGIPRVALAARP
jgi:release factor glutamine methyltransferase